MNRTAKLLTVSLVTSCALIAGLLPNTGRGSTNVFDFNSDPASILTVTRAGDTTALANMAGVWFPSGGSTLDQGIDPSTNGYFAITQTTPLETSHGMKSTIVFDDFDGGVVIAGFTFSCDVRIGGGTSTPADGFSINFARDTDPVLASGSFISPPEEGTETGLAVCFDAYNNGSGDVVGLTIKVDNTVITNLAMPTLNGLCADATSLQTGPNDAGITNLCWQPASVKLGTDGRLTVTYKNVILVTNFQTLFVPGAGRLVMGGRTGASYQEQDVDNIRIITQPSTAPIVTGNLGTPAGFRLSIVDSGFATPDTNTITLTLDGVPVSASSITQSGFPGGGNGITTVNYDSGVLLTPGSTHTNTVHFTGATFSGAVDATNVFTIPSYTILSADQKAPGIVHTTETGFAGRMHQVPGSRSGSDLIYVERQLADGYLDMNTGVPLANIASAGEFTNQLINWAQSGNAGYFSYAQPPFYIPDDPLPGLPGIDPYYGTSTYNNAAVEILTILDLPVGSFQIGINRKDGFKLSVGKEPRDVFDATVLASAPGSGDTIINLAVTNAGKYPFRLVWDNNFSVGELEFYVINLATGSKTLINDLVNGSPVAAYCDTSALTLPYVRWVSPAPGEAGVALDQPVIAKLMDGSAATVLAGSVSLTVNGSGTASVTKSGTETLVVLSNALSSAGANTATLTYSTTAGGPYVRTWTISRPAALWKVLPLERPYITASSGDAQTRDLERGMAYNPVTDHLLVGARWTSPTVKGIYILDAATGKHLGELPGVSNIVSGGTICLTRVVAADDGAIYACNFGTISDTSPLKIYRWGSESAGPEIAYQGNPTTGIANVRWGYWLTVRGAGTNTQLLLGQHSSSTLQALALLRTVDGTNFTSTVMTNSPPAPSDAWWAGLTWGDNGTFWGKQTGKALYQWQPNPDITNATVLRTYSALSTINLVSFSFSPDFRYLAGILPSTTPHSIALFDISDLTAGPRLVTSWQWWTANSQAVAYLGNAYVANDKVVALVMDNGVAAFPMPVPPQLHVQKSGQNLVLTWSASALGFALRESPSLSSPTWTPVNATYTRAGSQMQVIVPADATARFYRLVK